MAKKSKPWKKEEVTKVFELLLDQGSDLTVSREFRSILDRDQNLFVNQITREANSNIAYSKVHFDLEGVSDKEFWARIDSTPYSDMIEDNAAAALLKMAQRNDLVE